MVAGRYQLGPVLGHGGMGEVRLAHDHLLDRSVAIKRLRPNAPRRGDLCLEARIAARVAHRAVVRVLDLVDDLTGAHIIMEIVDGPSLLALHERGPMAVCDAVRIAIELAGALDAVHDCGALHLDVKIENVLLMADGQPKLIDFGIARLANDPYADEIMSETGANAMVGTPRAMSPEQIQGDPIDARSDLYSLGVLLYELLVGTSLFAAGSDIATLSRVMTEPVPPLDARMPGLPPELTALVAALLDRTPAFRPQTARELHARLSAAAARLF